MNHLPPSNYDPDPEACYIVGGGPSLTNFDWAQLNNKFVIAINRAYEVLPMADIVYFTDDAWYKEHENRLLQHEGILIKGSLVQRKTVDDRVVQYKLKQEKGLQTAPLTLSHGCNSTYAAINLAGVHLGFKTIYLLGVDLQHAQGQSHWHDGHKRIDPESIYEKMLKNFREVAPMLLTHGVTVYNINTPEMSALDCFEFSTKLKLNPDRTPAATTHWQRTRNVQSPMKIRSHQELIQERRRRVNQIQTQNRDRHRRRPTRVLRSKP